LKAQNSMSLTSVAKIMKDYSNRNDSIGSSFDALCAG
jgi:hypothetical protein